MSETKFTPGPWEWPKFTPGPWHVVWCSPQPKTYLVAFHNEAKSELVTTHVICALASEAKNAEANAVLIASAPGLYAENQRLWEVNGELYAALEQSARTLENIRDYGALRHEEDWAKCAPVLAEIKAALAKARGE